MTRHIKAFIKALRDSERDAVVAAFQPAAVEVAEQNPPWIARTLPYIICTFFAILILWASLSRVDIIVTATGRLTTKAQSYSIQSLETAVVRSLDVKAGQLVRKGDLLATLDPTFATADASQLQKRLDSLEAEVRRIENELEGKVSRGQGKSSDMETQSDLHDKRGEEYRAKLKGYQADLERLEADLKGTQRSVLVLTERLEGLKKIEAMKSDLQDKKFLSPMALLEAKNQRLEVQQSLEDATNKMHQIKQQINQARASYEAFTKRWRIDALSDLVKAKRERDDALEQLNKAQRRTALVQITAPADAIVLEISKRSTGSITKEAEPLMTLVPMGVPIEGEVEVSAEDIGFVRVGDSARIKIDAFPFQKHGVVNGKVIVISPDSFVSSQPNSAGERSVTKAYYQVRIDNLVSVLRGVPKDFQLLPGMTIVAEIKVSERSVMSYLTYPLTKALDEAIREP